MGEDSVLIIGAGAAGLAAAHAPAREGLAVALLEAKDRLGGRMWTVQSQPDNLPIELGAEFIHGSQNQTWKTIRAARLRTIELPDRHWEWRDGTLRKGQDFWERLEEVFDRINTAIPDQDFQSLLDQAWGLNPDTAELPREFVEGFHAAEGGRPGFQSRFQKNRSARTPLPLLRQAHSGGQAGPLLPPPSPRLRRTRRRRGGRRRGNRYPIKEDEDDDE